jgi:hypothetical protein
MNSHGFAWFYKKKFMPAATIQFNRAPERRKVQPILTNSKQGLKKSFSVNNKEAKQPGKVCRRSVPPLFPPLPPVRISDFGFRALP